MRARMSRPARAKRSRRSGQVGDHADVPEEHRDRPVGRDREDVPFQGRAELRPDVIVVRQREKEPGVPHAADVEDGEDAGADHGEDRHRLGRAVDRGPPLLAQEAEDGRDQGAGMADADPEDEVDDRPAPVDRGAVAPDADAGGDDVGDARDGEDRRSRQATAKHHHHQAGVLPSTIPQILSVIQVKLRLCSTRAAPGQDWRV